MALLVPVVLAVGLWHIAEPRAPRIDWPGIERPGPVPSVVAVVDGDTIRHRGATVRLVGFDTPETGRQARCPRENALGRQATERLRTLVAEARAVQLETVRCACRPGTHGTRACNFGRACGTLRVDGRDVGGILVGEGLARPYVCGATSCPPRGSWC